MSMNKELEELRRIRAAEREAAEEAKRVEAEKQKERDRKSAFLMKASSFEQRKGPTDEEIKASVHKASAARKFNRMLSKQLSTGDGKNPISTELGLRNKLGNQTASSRPAHNSDWQLVEQEGGYPYYWNRVTNEVTYDVPEDLQEYRPPTPPRRQLPGMGTTAPTSSDWVLVQPDDGSAPYFWNSVSNEATYTEPAEGYVTSFAPQVHGEDSQHTTDEASQWISGVDPTSGYTYYYNTVTQLTQWEVPECLSGQAAGSTTDPPVIITSNAGKVEDIAVPQPETAQSTEVLNATSEVASVVLPSDDAAAQTPSSLNDGESAVVSSAHNSSEDGPRAVSMPRGVTKDSAFLSQLNSRISMRTAPIKGSSSSVSSSAEDSVEPISKGDTSVCAAAAVALALKSLSTDEAKSRSSASESTHTIPPPQPSIVPPPPRRLSQDTAEPESAASHPPVPAALSTDSPPVADANTRTSPPLPPSSVPPPPRPSDAAPSAAAVPPPAASGHVPPPPPTRPSSSSSAPPADATVVTGSLIAEDSEPVPVPSNVPPPPRPPPRPSDLSERPSNISAAERPSSIKSTVSSEKPADDGSSFHDGITTQELLNQLNAMKVSFDDYVDNYCNFERKGILKRRTTTEKLTHWKSDLIRTSLRADVTNEKDSVQLFRNVTGYMGDRSSSKPPDDHAVKILTTVLRAPEELRDELYTQICKQTNHNPSAESTVKGWQLMTLCLSVVRPSNILMLPLMSYCAETIKFAPNPQVAKYAEICLHNIPKICRSGSRKEIPTAEQRAAIVAGTLLCGEF